MTDEQTEPTVLIFDLDNLELGQITFLEMTLNEQCRDLLPTGEIITFDDIAEQFRAKREPDDEKPAPPPPRIRLPVGPILQTVGLMQLRETNPEATWEDAGKMKMKVEVEAPKGDPAAIVATAEQAARMPKDPMAILQEAAEHQLPPPTSIDEPTPSGTAPTSNSG